MKTAVEWLENELSRIGLTHSVIGDKISQAKEMEKQQMNCTWDDSRINKWGDDDLGKKTSFNDYYNETFKS